jgi:hypothetical protein
MREIRQNLSVEEAAGIIFTFKMQGIWENKLQVQVHKIAINVC